MFTIRTHHLAAAAVLVAMAFTLGCAAGSDSSKDPYGPGCTGGKCDALNPENDPANLGFTIKYELVDESMIGVTLKSDLTPYSPPTYFPFTSDGINNRRSGKASPAEKYDLAFNGWTPDEEFWSLKKLNSTSDREFDQACSTALNSLKGQPQYISAHQEAQRIFTEQLPAIPIFQHLEFATARPDICNFDLDLTASNYWNIEEFEYGDGCLDFINQERRERLPPDNP